MSKYKVYIDKVVDLMSSKGIKMVKPKEFSSEELAGLDWNLDLLLETEEKIITPSETLTYKDTRGNTCLRFLDYTKNYEAKDEEETDLDLVNRFLPIKTYPGEPRVFQQVATGIPLLTT